MTRGVCCTDSFCLEFRTTLQQFHCPASLNNNQNTANNISQLGETARVLDDADVVQNYGGEMYDVGIDSKFEKYLEHPVLINHVQWLAATAADTVITSDLIDFYLAACPAAMSAKLRNFMYFTADIKIRVVVQGTAQSFGQMVYQFVPYLELPALGSEATAIGVRARTDTVTNLKVLPHIVVDPSKTATYEIILPVCTPNGFYSFSSNFSYGSYQLRQYILNAMGSGTAVAGSANVCMYMSLVNPRFGGVTSVQMTSGVFEELKPGPLSTVAAGAASVADQIGNALPVISPVTDLFSKVARPVGRVLSALGFSKPPSQDFNLVLLNRTCDNYSQKDGKSAAIVLSASQATSESIAPSYGAGMLDDMSIAHIVKKPGIVSADQSITAATAAGALLKTMYVSPYYSLSSSANVFEPTPLGGIASVCATWNGELKFTFEFVASVFHRATVLIAYDPYPSGTAPTYATALSTLENTTVNISGNTTVEVVIPYMQPHPVLRNPGSNIFFADGTDPSYENGKLYVFLVNPVLSNGSTDAIKYNVYLSSDDITLMAPSAGFQTSRVLMTSNAFVSDVTTVRFGKGLRTNPGKSCFPDTVESVKDITCRAARYYESISVGVKVNGASAWGQNIPYPAHVIGTTNYLEHTLYGWIASAYLGVRGSTYMSSFPECENYYPAGTDDPNNPPGFFTAGDAQMTVAHHLHMANDLFMTFGTNPGFSHEDAYAWTQPNLSVTSRADTVLPYFVGWNFVPTRHTLAGYRDNFQVLINFNRWCFFRANIVIASGDDAVFCWFLGFPRVKVGT